MSFGKAEFRKMIEQIVEQKIFSILRDLSESSEEEPSNIKSPFYAG
jgi:hypothetical protein